MTVFNRLVAVVAPERPRTLPEMPALPSAEEERKAARRDFESNQEKGIRGSSKGGHSRASMLSAKANRERLEAKHGQLADLPSV